MQLPAHLASRQRRDLAARTAAGLSGLTAPFVSINGGQFTLVDASGDTMPLGAVTLDCLILDALEKVSRVFWGVDANGRVNVPDPSNPVPPVCFSDNGIGASSNASDPQSTSCQGCKWNQWAWPAVGGGSKPACGSTQKLALYVAQAPKHPWLLRVPVTSHKTLAKYFHSFAGQNFDTPDLWTRITVVPQGIGFSLTFEPSFKYDQSRGFVDEGTAQLTDSWVQARMTDQVIGRGDPAWMGQGRQEALQAPERPAPLPPPPAAPSAPAGFSMPAAPPFAPPAGAPAAHTASTSFAPPSEPSFPATQTQPAGTATTASPSNAPQQRRRRTVSPPAAPGNGAPRQAPFGIASGPAAPPPSEMQDALAKAFGLPTK